MMRIWLVLLTFCCLISVAQTSKEKIDAARVAYIKERIELTENQDALFWPLYNDYQDKRSELRRAMKGLKTETGGLAASDEQLRADLQKLFELREKELALEKEYYNRFLKVISIRQLTELMKAEKQFTLLLVQKLEAK